jgi:sigma-B regulation protein RsbU (phosphoserine phosphatase)
MPFVDLSGSARIPALVEAMASLSRARDPRELLDGFVASMRRIYGPRGYIALRTEGLEPGSYRVTRFLTLEGEDRVPVTDPWAVDEGAPVRRGGILGTLVGDPRPKLGHHLELGGDPVFGEELAPFRSLIAVPTFDRGEVANWTVLLLPDPEGYGAEDLEQAILRVNLTGTMVQNIRLARELEEANRWIHREVDAIAAIQRSLLPERLPDIPGLDLASSFQTYDRAGGDYYEFLPPRGDPEGPWGILIADASGHGPAAAVVTAMLDSILHAYTGDYAEPAGLLRHLNHHLHAKDVEHSFVTAFYAVFDPRTRDFAFSRAGHPPPLLRPSGGGLHSLLEAGSVPLGILPEPPFRTAVRRLGPGDLLLLYTDGITETVGPDGRFFGVEGVETALTACRQENPG